MHTTKQRASGRLRRPRIRSGRLLPGLALGLLAFANPTQVRAQSPNPAEVGSETDRHNSEFLFGFSGLSSASLTLGLASGGTATVNTGIYPNQTQGWWNNVIGHFSFNPNYICASDVLAGVYNNFFSFEISGLAGKTVTSATFNVQRATGESSSGKTFHTYSIFDVSTPAATLKASGPANPAIHSDLASGVSYGTHNISVAGSFSEILHLALNANAVADINTAISKGNRFFSIGGTLVPTVAPNIAPTCQIGSKTAECTGANGTQVTVTGTAKDADGDSLTVQWFVGTTLVKTQLIPSGGATTSAIVSMTYDTYPLGSTPVKLVVSDGTDTTSCPITVTIVDTTAPVVSCSAVNSLSPPNHDLVNVGFTASATDVCGTPTVTYEVWCDEDDETDTGDGVHSPDAKDIANTTLRLRAERKGNADGRVYLIIVRAKDVSGNKSTACCTVTVSKSESEVDRASVATQAASAVNACATTDAAPAGFVKSGDGVVLGPKQ